MNLIAKISRNSVVMQDIPLHTLLYFYMAGSVIKQDDYLTFDGEELEVFEKFSEGYTEDEIEEALDYLHKQEVILRSKKGITLGYAQEGRKKMLFLGVVENNISKEVATVFDYLDAYKKTVKGTPRQAVVKKLGYDLDALIAKPLVRWTAYDFVNLFRIVYESVFQDNCREMNGKETGQMKNVLKLFNPAAVFKMVVYFIVNSQEFSKSYPTMGLLTFHKDNLYHKVRGKAISKTKNRIGKDESGF